DPVSVADRLARRGTGHGDRRGGGADVIDDTAQVAVADRLAVLAERNDGAVYLIDFRVREGEAERLAARLHRVPAGVATEHEARRHRLAHVLGPHDFVGSYVLEHAVLMDARFV